jgi:hypothetical protein
VIATARLIRYPAPQERGFVRTLTAAIITVGMVASLSACAGTGSSAGDCEPTATSGAASSLVKATGAAGDTLDVSFPTPLISKKLEVSTIEEGDGRTLLPGEIADFSVTVANAGTGEVIPIQTSDFRRTVGESADTFGVLLECATVGSRLAATLPVEDAFGPGSTIEGTDTIVLVVDVARSYKAKADGVSQLSRNGLPAVVLAPNGQPGIVVPDQAAPETLTIAPLKLGDGATVSEGDAVVAHYTSMVWGDSDILESTWDADMAATLVAAGDGQGPVVPGLAEALVGATVGSQILVVIPPSDGYAEGAAPAGVTADSTLIYVVDILGIQKD